MRAVDRDPESKAKDFAVHVAQVELSTGRLLSPPVCVRKSPFGVAEGSHLFKRGEWYYLFVAEGGTEEGHQEWVFRSKEGVYGPWESQAEPVLCNGVDGEVQRTGHADLVEDGEGQWWSVFLGVRPVKRKDGGYMEPQLGRETYLVKVDWINDWPIFNAGKKITLLTQGRNPIMQQITQPNPNGVLWRASLSPHQTTLELGWYQENTPLKQCYTLAERPGYLRLYGSCYNLSSPEAPAMLLRKQQSYHDEFSAELDFYPKGKGYEAGVTVWWNMYSYASIGVTSVEREGSFVRTVVCRVPTGVAGKMETLFPLLCSEDDIPGRKATFDDAAPVKISAKASPTTYTLVIGQDENMFEFCFDAENLTVMPTEGAAFTGAMFGIYAFGNWEPVLDPADFSNLLIREHGH